MPKTKASRSLAMPKISVSSRPRELVDIGDDTQDESKLYTCLEQFEMQFAFKLSQYDKLLEEKLVVLNRAKERLKIKYSTLLKSTLEATSVMELLNDKENVSTTGVQNTSQRKRSQMESVTSSQGSHAKQSSRKSKRNKEQALVAHTGAGFQTPAISTGLSTVHSVMPKVPMNTPISMLRLPRQGELALSLTGSPVMVTAMSHESKPNINIPLHGNQVLTLIPHERLDPNCVPELDDEAVQQLEALNKNLQAFINMTK